MKRLSLTVLLLIAAAFAGTSLARSQTPVLGDPPRDYWAYGDLPFDPACFQWDWQERSWYDMCTRLHHSLAWRSSAGNPYGVVVRTKD